MTFFGHLWLCHAGPLTTSTTDRHATMLLLRQLHLPQQTALHILHLDHHELLRVSETISIFLEGKIHRYEL
jgi:hypothetical protein